MNVVSDPQALNKLFVLDAIDFGEIKIPELKQYLKQEGIVIR